jgi:long-chain acyl-CoA synthetase
VSGILAALRSVAAGDPSAIALRGATENIGHGRLLTRVEMYAAELGRHDARVIGLLADNGIDWIVADLAALDLGAALVPVPHFFTASQVAHIVDSTGMDSLLVDDPARLPAEIAERFRQGARLGELVMFEAVDRPPRSATRHGPAKITFTSGSTGTPKGVCLSADCIEQVTFRLHGRFEGISIERHLCVLPLATLLENIAGVYVPLLSGASVDVLPLSVLGLSGSSRMDGAALLETIGRRHIESLILQPAMLRELTAAAQSQPDADTSLTFVAVGGARVSEADLAAARAAGIPACQGYGLSECGSVVALNTPDEQRSASVGRPLPGLEVAIADDGEILVRGQHMDGYLGEPGCASGTIATGDLGFIDDDGFLYVTGRKKHMYITAFGRNVSPEWPESELVHEDEIAQACVFGEGAAAATAVLVPARPDITATGIEAAVQQANRRLPDYASVGSYIVSAVPFTAANGLLTATGKPRRDAIRARFLAATEAPEPACLPGFRANPSITTRQEKTL